MAEPLDPTVWRRKTSGRLLIVGVMLAAWVTAIEARLVYLQVYQHDRLTAEADSQQSRVIDAPARRGDILDRQGRVLAYSVDVDSVYAVPSKFKSIPDTIRLLCDALDGCTRQDVQKLEWRFQKQKEFAYVRRRVSVDQARRVMALRLPGIGLIKEPRRFYPNRELAGHVLGFVGFDRAEDDVRKERLKGLGGIEERYDDLVRGTDGKLLVQHDLKGKAFSRVGNAPVQGATLELTIDQGLQYIAERELRAAVEANRAKGGSVVVMEPATGEILAMANEPRFNPNTYNDADPDDRRNRAIQDTYEPGSTFKMITATAGVQEGAVRPDTLIETGNGVLVMGSRVVRDTHAHGTIPVSEVIALSSNIGAIKIGWRLGAARLGKYVKLFGFGTRLSRDFRGESAGLVDDESSWTENGALASVAMGYQIGVTPLQMAAAASAIANGGELLQPRILRAVIQGNTRQVVPRRVMRRVMSPATSASLIGMLEGVVEHGTAKVTQIEGFTIAGKTGTSAKLDGTGHYSHSEYNASFVGFVPSRAPRLTVIVWIDTPRAGSTYGGVVAGPVFQRIASEALRHLGVPPTVNPRPPVLVQRDLGNEIRVAGPRLPVTVLSPAPALPDGDHVLPELRGLGGREALRVLSRLGLTARVSGDGVVLEQDPPAGTTVEPGSSCRLALGRVPAREAGTGGLQP